MPNTGRTEAKVSRLLKSVPNPFFSEKHLTMTSKSLTLNSSEHESIFIEEDKKEYEYNLQAFYMGLIRKGKSYKNIEMFKYIPTHIVDPSYQAHNVLSDPKFPALLRELYTRLYNVTNTERLSPYGKHLLVSFFSDILGYLRYGIEALSQKKTRPEHRLEFLKNVNQYDVPTYLTFLRKLIVLFDVEDIIPTHDFHRLMTEHLEEERNLSRLDEDRQVIPVRSATKTLAMRPSHKKVKLSVLKVGEYARTKHEEYKVPQESINKFFKPTFDTKIRTDPNKKIFFSNLYSNFISEHGDELRRKKSFVIVCYSPSAKILLNAYSWDSFPKEMLTKLKADSYLYFHDCRDTEDLSQQVVMLKDNILYLYGVPVDIAKLKRSICSSTGGVKNPRSLTEIILVERYLERVQSSGYYLTNYITKNAPYWTTRSFLRMMRLKDVSMSYARVYDIYLDAKPEPVRLRADAPSFVLVPEGKEAKDDDDALPFSSSDVYSSLEDRDAGLGSDPTATHGNDETIIDGEAADVIEDLLNEHEVDNLRNLETAIETREEQPHDRAGRLPEDVRVNMIQTHLATAAFMHSTFNEGLPDFTAYIGKVKRNGTERYPLVMDPTKVGPTAGLYYTTSSLIDYYILRGCFHFENMKHCRMPGVMKFEGDVHSFYQILALQLYKSAAREHGYNLVGMLQANPPAPTWSVAMNPEYNAELPRTEFQDSLPQRMINDMMKTINDLTGTNAGVKDFYWLMDIAFVIYRLCSYTTIGGVIENAYMLFRMFPDSFSYTDVAVYFSIVGIIKRFRRKTTAVPDETLVAEMATMPGYEPAVNEFYEGITQVLTRMSITGLCKSLGLAEVLGVARVIEEFERLFPKSIRDGSPNDIIFMVMEAIKSIVSKLVECVKEKSFDPLFSTSRKILDIERDIKYLCQHPLAVSDPDDTVEASFEKERKKIPSIIPPSFTRVLPLSVALDVIEQLRTEIASYARLHPEYPVYLHNYLQSLLNEKEAAIRKELTNYKRRIPAYCIRIVGPPNTSKTFLTKDLVSSLHQAEGNNGVLGEKSIFKMTHKSKHFDGISSSVYALHLDDVDHSKTGTEGIDMLAYAVNEAANSNAWRPPMAELHNKGMTISPHVLVQTTNIKNGGAKDALNDEGFKAHERRISAHIQVKVLDGYRNLQGGVDIAAVKANKKSFYDVLRYDLYIFVGRVDHSYERYDNLHASQLMMHIRSDFLKKRQHNIEAEEDVIERCVHCGLNITGDHSECAKYAAKLPKGEKHVKLYAESQQFEQWALMYLPLPNAVDVSATTYRAAYGIARKELAFAIFLIVNTVLIVAALPLPYFWMRLWLVTVGNFLYIMYVKKLESLDYVLPIRVVNGVENAIFSTWRRYYSITDRIRRIGKRIDWNSLSVKLGTASLVLAAVMAYKFYNQASKTIVEMAANEPGVKLGSSKPVIRKNTKEAYGWAKNTGFEEIRLPAVLPAPNVDMPTRYVRLTNNQYNQSIYGLLLKNNMVLTKKHFFLPNQTEIATNATIKGSFNIRIDHGSYSNSVYVTDFANFKDKDVVVFACASAICPLQNLDHDFLEHFLDDSVSLNAYLSNVKFVNMVDNKEVTEISICARPRGGSRLLKYKVNAGKGDCTSALMSHNMILGTHVAASADGEWRFAEILKRSEVQRAVDELSKIGMITTEGFYFQPEEVLPKACDLTTIPPISNLHLAWSVRKKLGVYHPYLILFHDNSSIDFTHKTNLVPSPLRANERLQKFFLRRGADMMDYRPAEAKGMEVEYEGLDEKTYQTPFSKNLLGSTSNSIPRWEWRRAVATYLDFNFAPMEPLAPLSDYETVKGNEYLNHINRKSSGGPGFGQNADNFSFENPEHVEVNESVMIRMREIIAIARRGVIPITSCKRQLKDELKKSAQVVAGKIRVFSVTQVPFILAQRKMLGPLIKIMRANWREMMTSLGYDLSNSFNRDIMEHLGFYDESEGAGPNGDGYGALDAIEFDLTGDDWMTMESAFMVMNILYQHGYSVDDAYAAAVLWLAAFFAFSIIKGDYYMAIHILNSGMFITFIYNCIKSALAYIVAYYRTTRPTYTMPSRNPAYSDIMVCPAIRKLLRALFCGDDAFIRVHSSIRHLMTQKTIKEALSDVFRVQPEKKEHEMVDHLKFKDATFMKRTYDEIRVDDYILNVAKLEMSSLAKSLSHYDSKITVPLDEHMYQMCDFFLREMFHHGEEAYEEARDIVSEHLGKTFPSWRESVPAFVKPGYQAW